MRMSDLIDREALLDECLNHYEVGNIEQNCTMDWIVKTVRNAPTVDAAPVLHGAWISLGHGLTLNFKCSSCGNDVDCPTCMYEPIYRFCPYCGSMMREVQE